MSVKRMSILILILAGLVVVWAMFMFAFPVQAQGVSQVSDGASCVGCHEDLYYLHDTGKAYCLNESPMTCVDCHGGNPSATTKEEAHFDRSAHPVINDNGKKCYECHPSEAEARVDYFDMVAGIGEMEVPPTCEPGDTAQAAGFPESEPEQWTLRPQAIPLFVMAALGLAAYIIFKIRHL